MSLAGTARALSGGHLHAGATTNVACAQQILSQRANCYLSQLRPAAAVCVSGMVMKTALRGGGRVPMPKRRTTAPLQSLAIAATVVRAVHVIIWLAGYSLIVTNALGDSPAGFAEQAD
jgi:hypothetical protein